MRRMTSTERVAAALSLSKPDRVPFHCEHWGTIVERWRERHGLRPRPFLLRTMSTQPVQNRGQRLPPCDFVYDPEMNSFYGIDLVIVRAHDEFFPSREQVIGEEGDYLIRRDGWGRLIRSRNDGTVDQTLEVALADKCDLDKVEFESPYDDRRYEAFIEQLQFERAKPGGGSCTMPRVGGPFLRSWWLRGEEQFLIDIARDPKFVYELVGQVVDHRIAIGLEQLRRGSLYEVGIGIFDDIAYNRGVFISPRSYEKLFLPHMARMVEAFKEAGAACVLYHSDGDIRSMLDAFVEIGIDAIHPVEPRAGMDIVKLREQYGDSLALVGGLCNTIILPSGTDHEVREHVLRALGAAREGGVVLGCHSIGADISLERYEYLHSLLAEYGGRPRPGALPYRITHQGPVTDVGN